MSYEKQTWVNGVSPLNAERLNHMEEGIHAVAGAVEELKQSGTGGGDSGNETVDFSETGDFVEVLPSVGQNIEVVSEFSRPEAWGHSNRLVLHHVTSENIFDIVGRIGGVGTVIENNGLKAVINADGTATITGTNTSDSFVDIISTTQVANEDVWGVYPPGTYTVQSGVMVQIIGASYPTPVSMGNKFNTFTMTEPFIVNKVKISVASGQAMQSRVKLGIFRGDSIPELDSYLYSGKEYIVNFDSTVYKGSYNWSTGELLSEIGEVLGKYEPASIVGYAGANYFFTGFGSSTVSGKAKNNVNGSNTVDPEAWGVPVLYLNGDTSGISKENAVDMTYVYGENSGNCTLKWQGSSSIERGKEVGGKFNFTMKSEEAIDVGWGAQKKYCLKANVIDASHARNVVSAKLWGQICASLDGEDALLASSPNHGAVDGFPIVLVINGNFYGVYTWNIPKDGWMASMGSGTNECILCAGNPNPTNYFKAEAQLTTDLEIEYITDENSTEWAKSSVNNLIRACMNSDGSDLDTTIATMFDWKRAIAYFIFTALIRGDDNLGKNYLLLCTNGTKWSMGHYDMDSTYGLHWNGRSFQSAKDGTTFAYMKAMHRVMELIYLYKKDELKTMYATIRDTVMSEDNVMLMFRNFYGQIPKGLLVADNERWPLLPNTAANDIGQIADWYRIRCAVIDKEIESI